MSIYDKDRVLGAGEKFTGGSLITFTVIESAIISDDSGNQIGSYELGTTYQGSMPKGTFTITSGSIKLWG